MHAQLEANAGSRAEWQQIDREVTRRVGLEGQAGESRRSQVPQGALPGWEVMRLTYELHRCSEAPPRPASSHGWAGFSTSVGTISPIRPVAMYGRTRGIFAYIFCRHYPPRARPRVARGAMAAMASEGARVMAARAAMAAEAMASGDGGGGEGGE